jgi:hypothetical protein
MYLWCEEREPSGPWAVVGTAHHAVSEMFLKTRGEYDSAMNHPLAKDIPTAERGNIERYLHQLEPLVPRINGVEESWTVKFQKDAPPILARLDLRYNDFDQVMNVRDHKSNRQYESAEIWRKKPQGRIYPWLLHHLGYDTNGRVRMSIGYTNIDVPAVEFDVFREEAEQTREWLKDVYKQMCDYYDSMVAHPNKQYMCRANQYCATCKFNGTCKEYQTKFGNLDEFAKGLQSKLFPKDTFGRYQQLQIAKKVVETQFNEAKKQVVAEASANENLRVSYEKNEVVLEYGETRKLPFTSLWAAMYGMILEHGDAVFNSFMEQADDILSVSVGGLDKFLEANPGLREAIEPLVVKVPNENPTIKVIKL